MEGKDFTTLEVWQRAHSLMLKTYSFCKLLPAEEKYNLTSQLKRSISSVPANIAEGYGRYYYKDNTSFCRKARGSLDESRNHILKAKDLQFAPVKNCNDLLNECLQVRMMMNGYIRYLNKSKPE